MEQYEDRLMALWGSALERRRLGKVMKWFEAEVPSTPCSYDMFLPGNVKAITILELYN